MNFLLIPCPTTTVCAVAVATLQVEEAVAQQHSGDGRGAAVAAGPAGAAGAVPGPHRRHQPGRGRAHHLPAAPPGLLIATDAVCKSLQCLIICLKRSKLDCFSSARVR